MMTKRPDGVGFTCSEHGGFYNEIDAAEHLEEEHPEIAHAAGQMKILPRANRRIRRQIGFR